MATVIPRSIPDLIAFAQSHIATWSDAPTEIGLSSTICTAISGQLTTASAAADAKVVAHNAARSSTITQNAEAAALRELLAEAVKLIKAYAETQAKPDLVYSAADIPMPKTPAPAPAPAQPTDLRISLDPLSGAITLRWKASNPGGAGVSYIVRRRAGAAPFTVVGITGEKSFTDLSFTAGPDSVEYSVQGARAGVAGEATGILIRFGSSDDGGFTTSIVEAPKLAA